MGEKHPTEGKVDFLLLVCVPAGLTGAVEAAAQEETSDLRSLSHQGLMVRCEGLCKKDDHIITLSDQKQSFAEHFVR